MKKKSAFYNIELFTPYTHLVCLRHFTYLLTCEILCVISSFTRTLTGGRHLEFSPYPTSPALSRRLCPVHTDLQSEMVKNEC